MGVLSVGGRTPRWVLEDAEVFSILENFFEIGEQKEGSEARVSIMRVCEGGAKDHARKCGQQGQGKCRSRLQRDGN